MDGLYAICSVGAGVLMVATCALILASALARPFGWVVPDANELAGFCFVTMVFLSLAPTFRTGGHIRVNLVTGRMPDKVKPMMELWCLAVTLAFTTYLTWWLGHLSITSYRFGDVSQGILAVPLWIPQAAMTLGAAVLTLTLVDNLITVARGREPDYERLAATIDETADR